MKNKDPFAPWNSQMVKNSPFAPHKGFDKDSPFKPWNQPFGRAEDLTDREKDYYGVPRKRKYEEESE